MGEPNYADPLYGVEQMFVTDRSGVLTGTSTENAELMRYTMKKAGSVKAAKIRAAAGGTSATTRDIVVGKSLAGTGAFSVFGTQAIGTLATNEIVDWTVIGDYAADDDLVIQHLGTGVSTTYDLEIQIYYSQKFVNA